MRRAFGLFLATAALAATSAQAAGASLRHEFSSPREAVYDALVATLPTQGFTVKELDSSGAKLTASNPGGDVALAVVTTGSGKSALESGSAALNAQAFDKVVQAVGERLKAAAPKASEDAFDTYQGG